MPTGNDLTPPAVAYAWAELARRAGFDPLNAPVTLVYEGNDSVPAIGAGPSVVIRRAPDGAFDELCRAAEGSIAHIPAGMLYPDGNGPDRTVPLLFVRAEAPTDSLVRHHDTNPTAVFDIDIISAAFFMLSRWEETVSTCTDTHGRFPSTASVAVRQGFIDCPVVDEYALVLRAWIMRIAPLWRPSVGAFRVQLSHDVDRLFTARGWRSVVRRILGDVVRRKSIGSAVRTTLQIVREYGNPEASQSVRGVFDLASASRERGMSSAFYFIAAAPAPRNGDYDIEGHVTRSLIERLVADGFEIGLHAGYDTMTDRAALAVEYRRMSARASIRGSRQHYLRVRVPETWRSLDAVGLHYDTSMGFADREGFRCGTCHPFTVFDIESDHPLQLVEVPLIVMDGTLRFYRGLTPVAAMEAVSRLARRCRDVEGTFTLLWHNTSFGADWAGWKRAYLAMLDDLAGLR